MSNLHIAHVSSESGLYHRYAVQNNAQPCFVSLNCKTGVLSADWRGEIGNAVPMHVYQGHELRWSIPCLRASVVNALLDELSPLAEVVVRGYSGAWENNNYVANYDQKAEEAMEQIEFILDRKDFEGDTVRIWSADEWFGGYGGFEKRAIELGITAESSDEELELLADKEENSAIAEAECDKVEGVLEHFQWIRSKLKEEMN